VNRLLELDPLLVESVSTTTRAPRGGEVEGEDYVFVDHDAFERMKEDELVEWALVHGEYYGTPKSFVSDRIAEGRDVVMNIDIQGGDSVKKVFPGVVLVFILPPSFETLEKRIRGRGDVGAEALQTRLQNARKELSYSVNYTYMVVNDSLDRTVGEIGAIIVAERARRERKEPDFIRGFAAKEE
jgi:guanylate kinase